MEFPIFGNVQIPTQRAYHVESTSIPRGYYVDTLKTKIQRFSTSFPRTFFRCNFDGPKTHVVLLFFFGVISMVQKSTSFTRTFLLNFTGWNIHIVSTYFLQLNFSSRKIHVFSTYFFRCIFACRKTHVVSAYFFRCNFAGSNIHVVSTYVFQCNFDGRKIHVFCTYFSCETLTGRNSTWFLVYSQANENIQGGFLLLITSHNWVLQDFSP